MDLPNTQIPEPRVPVDDRGHTIDLHSMFPTLQGEGPFSGMPAYFVRLAGCNLQCPLCDTEYTDGRTKVDTLGLVKHIVGQPQKLVVVTGGEPFRQNIYTLVELLTAAGKLVQVETNGRLDPHGFSGLARLQRRKELHVVISPKTGRISDQCASLAVAFKYVLCADEQDPDDLLPTRALGHAVGRAGRVARPPAWWHGPIYVHPADEQDEVKNELNLSAAAQAVLQFPEQDRRLGLQVHKYVGLE